MWIINSLQVNPRCYKCEVTSYYLIEDVENPFNLGVYVDIFVIDFLPDDEKKSSKTIKWLKSLHREYVLKTVKTRKGRSFYKNIILSAAHIILKPISTRSILLKMDKVAREASESHSSKCGALSSFAYEDKEIMRSEWYANFQLSTFEDREFVIPTAYNEILTQLYGDYMTPPPMESQVTHHVNKAYWKKNN